MLEERVRKLDKNYIFSLAVLSDIIDPDDFDKDKRETIKNDFVFFCRKQNQNMEYEAAWRMYKIYKRKQI